MDAPSASVVADNIIVAYPGHQIVFDIGGMNDIVHVLFDFHGFIMSDQGPFDQIVSLAVAKKALFFGPPIFFHERIVDIPHIRA